MSELDKTNREIQLLTAVLESWDRIKNNPLINIRKASQRIKSVENKLNKSLIQRNNMVLVLFLLLLLLPSCQTVFVWSFESVIAIIVVGITIAFVAALYIQHLIHKITSWWKRKDRSTKQLIIAAPFIIISMIAGWLVSHYFDLYAIIFCKTH